MNDTTTAITVGAEVVGTDGKLGEVERVIVDAREDRATDIVVKHGFLFHGERVVPLAHVTRVEAGAVHLDIDKRMFETMNGFTEDHINAPNPDYVGTPGTDLQGTYRGNLTLEATWAAGAAGAMAGKPMGFPGGEQLTPDDIARPALAAGTDVLTSDGEKIGEVGEFSVVAETGQITRLSLRRGMLFKHEVEIPVDWVRDVSSEGVLLTVDKAQIEALER